MSALLAERGDKLMKADSFDKPRSEWELLINEWVFDEEVRRMLVLNLLDGQSYGQIAEKLNISIDKVSKKVRKAKKYLFKHLK